MEKQCEVCSKEIPSDFINLLCADCYKIQSDENEMRKQDEIEAKKEMPETIVQPKEYNLNGITDPNYQENPEAEDKDQVQANITQFLKTGLLLWHPTRMIYEFIKNQAREMQLRHPQSIANGGKHYWNPTIIDVGCGSGVGSNVLSQEATFVWGIDKNELSVKFAKEAFTRVKNTVYPSAQVTFDVFDIIKETRQTMKFDMVVAVEIIEHIYDYKTFLKRLIAFDNGNANSPTEYYISCPNRNNKHISKVKPKNSYHVREWTSEEFNTVLSEFFSEVTFFTSAGEVTERVTEHTPLLARCQRPKK